MPRIVDYPRAALDRSLELAAAVEELGGECSLEAAADRLGASPGGAFGALVSTAAKYGWIAIRRGRLRTEPRYRTYRLAYDDAERRAALTEALRNVPLYDRLLERFGDRTLPEDRLPRLLVREFGVPESAAGRVSGWFVDAAVAAGLLAGGQLRSSPTGTPARTVIPTSPVTTSPAPTLTTTTPLTPGALAPSGGDARPLRYTIRISGPDLDSTVEVGELADLELARALLAKVERALRAGAPR